MADITPLEKAGEKTRPDYNKSLRDQVSPYAKSLLAPIALNMIDDIMRTNIPHKERVERTRAVLRSYQAIMEEK